MSFQFHFTLEGEGVSSAPSISSGNELV